MELVGITDDTHPYWKKAWKLYRESFPLREQRTLEQHMLAMLDPAFHADIITDGGRFVGLLFYWEWGDKWRFIEHFATDRSLRGGGYGARALGMLARGMRKAEPADFILPAALAGAGESTLSTEDVLDGFVTMLEIDPPVDEISSRREAFYKRNGYTTNPYEHIHPSFRQSTPAHQLLIMSYPRAISVEEFAEFRRFMFDVILKYSDLESRTL